jgi:uncharacterized membrane protein
MECAREVLPVKGSAMDWSKIHAIVVFIQHCVSTIGILIIIIGIFVCLMQYIIYIVKGQLSQSAIINNIRLNLARILLLGLEFIVAADLIGTTTTPDYYSVGLLAIIVLVRTVLSFSINRELMSLKD